MKDSFAILPAGFWKSLIFQLFPRVMSLMNGGAGAVFTIMVICVALEAINEQYNEIPRWTVEHNRSHSNDNGYRLLGRSREESETARLCVKILNTVRDIRTFTVLFSVYWPFALQSLTSLCDLPCGGYALFRLNSIAKYFFKSPSNGFQFEGQSLKYSMNMFQRKVDNWKPAAGQEPITRNLQLP